MKLRIVPATFVALLALVSAMMPQRIFVDLGPIRTP